MRITIDFDPNTKGLSVLIDRGTLSNGWPPTPPPPPNNEEFRELTSWLNQVFETSIEKFKDQKIAAIRYKYDPSKGEDKGFYFITENEIPPAPPKFINN